MNAFESESSLSKSRFLVRKLLPGDHLRWRSLWDAYVRFYQADVSDEVTSQTWERLLSDGGHDGLVCVDTENDQVAGFVTYLFHPSTWTLTGYCYLEDLFVEESVRGCGAGRALIESVVELASAADVSRVYWHTDTGNQTARCLYDSIGKLADVVQYRMLTSEE